MPKRPSKNVVGKYIELDPELARRMELLAVSNGRTFKDEAEDAFRRHLAAPTVIRTIVERPELPPSPSTVSPPAEPKKRTRRKKGDA